MQFVMTFLLKRSQMPEAELSNRCFREMMPCVDDLTASGLLLFDFHVLPAPERRATTASIPRV